MWASSKDVQCAMHIMQRIGMLWECMHEKAIIVFVDCSLRPRPLPFITWRRDILIHETEISIRSDYGYTAHECHVTIT